MNIRNETKKNERLFANLKSGDVYLSQGHLDMKVIPPMDHPGNAVRLVSGMVVRCEVGAVVYAVDAELVWSRE